MTTIAWRCQILRPTPRFSRLEQLTLRKSKRLIEGLVSIVCSSIEPRTTDSSTIKASAKCSFYVGGKSVSQQIGIPGIVRNGVVVPQSNHPLPEGSHVEIRLEPGEMPSSLKSEIEAWDKASDDSWNWIETLESDEK